jgi:ABC-2 type transport system permease protein
MLRVHFAEVIAWRAEFVIWALAHTLPLIMLALWSAVAREAPIGRYGQHEFRIYFLATLVYRSLASCWLVWELNYDIRNGVVASRLLRPLHPLIWYSLQQLAALPLRLVLVAPVIVISLIWVGPGALGTEPWRIAWLVPLLVGAWALAFLVQALIGTLAFFWDSALGVFDLWLGFYFVLSGYLVPLDLFPAWLRDLGVWLPFRYMLSFPVEVTLGFVGPGEILKAVTIQWLWVLILAGAAMATWQAGIRRYAAFGG